MAKEIDDPDAPPRRSALKQPLITPSAPPQQSDPQQAGNTITFLLNTTEQISGDRTAICSASHELSRIINETTPVNGCYRLGDVSSVELEAIIRFFETTFIKFNDLDDALQKLEFAKRYLCPGLVRRCVKEVDSRLTTANVIKVYRTIRFHAVSGTPSKVVIEKRTPEECLEALLYNVFQFIDMNASVVLQRDEILDAKLNFTEIEMILRRDALMTTETDIFNLIANWSRVECQNRNLDLTTENRRRVLGPLSYVPR